MNFIKDLIKMANHLDSSGHYKEADLVDQIIVKLSGDVLNFPGHSGKPRVEVIEGAMGELIDFPQSGTESEESVTEPKPNDIKTLVEGKDEDDFEDLEPTSSGIKKVFKAGQQGEGLVLFADGFDEDSGEELCSVLGDYGFECYYKDGRVVIKMLGSFDRDSVKMEVLLLSSALKDVSNNYVIGPKSKEIIIEKLSEGLPDDDDYDPDVSVPE
jgi:hypothetical protein